MEQVWRSAALELAGEIIEHYELSTISGLLAAAHTAAAQDEIAVAVLGRFKAGKTSFLNEIFGRGILPVGVVPVTAVVTEVRFGGHERARVLQRDGTMREIPIETIGE
jgi:hypothetical protein